MRRSRSGGDSALPIANRVARLGGLTAALVALAICAIVQQAVMGPVGPQSRAHVRTRPTTKGSATPRATAKGSRPAPTPSLVRRVRAIVLNQRATAARKALGVQRLPQPVVSVSRVDRGRNWAFGGSVIPPPPGATVLPDTSLFVAVRKKGDWQVALAGSADFIRLLRQAPVTLLPKDERSLLEHYGGASPPKRGIATGLSLPWKTGQSWTLRPITGNGGLRFGGGDGRVLAPAQGRVYRLCAKAPGRGMLMLVHPNGLASVYYQVSDVVDVRDGALLQGGAYLGHTGTDQPCGGPPDAGSAIVRFALLCADHTVPLDGSRLGGWTLHTTAGHAWADRAGLRIDEGNPLLNFGTGAVSALPTVAPPTPRD